MVLPTVVQKDCRLWILYIHHRSKWMPNENCWSISQMELWTQAWTYLRKKVLQQWRLADIITMIKCLLVLSTFYTNIYIYTYMYTYTRLRKWLLQEGRWLPWTRCKQWTSNTCRFCKGMPTIVREASGMCGIFMDLGQCSRGSI